MRCLKIIISIFTVAFVCFLHTGAWATQTFKAMASKNCMNCHQNLGKKTNLLAGNLSSKSMKAKSIQMKINNKMELVKFNSETKVKNVSDIKSLKGTIAMRVYYKMTGTDRVATKIVAKPKFKVPENQLMKVDELAKLVAQGPEKGGYTLIDSRPPGGYQKGYIPTAINIPFPKMKAMADKLPKDKNRMVIFYCQGYR